MTRSSPTFTKSIFIYDELSPGSLRQSWVAMQNSGSDTITQSTLLSNDKASPPTPCLPLLGSLHASVRSADSDDKNEGVTPCQTPLLWKVTLLMICMWVDDPGKIPISSDN